MGSALYLHANLLLRLIAFYHHAKIRERELTRQAQLRAIFETGARVTHDIKNLLQSLQAVTAAVEYSKPEDADELNALLKRQLPTLGQRLQIALDKLQAPLATTQSHEPLSSWWSRLQSRYVDEQITFTQTLTDDPEIPTDMFDSVVDNLLDNARFKRANEPGIQIIVSINCKSNLVELSVSDTGSAIPHHIANKLFEAVVDSDAGLGIGLLQARRYANQHGYRLSLADNADNEQVRFSLSRRLESED